MRGNMARIQDAPVPPETAVTTIRVPTDLWTTSLMPEGILERWLVPDGADVSAGDPVACVRINDDLHEIISPATGRISAMSAPNTVVDPGAVIAQLGA